MLVVFALLLLFAPTVAAATVVDVPLTQADIAVHLSFGTGVDATLSATRARFVARSRLRPICKLAALPDLYPGLELHRWDERLRCLWWQRYLCWPLAIH